MKNRGKGRGLVAKTYFLNAQSEKIAVELNAGAKHMLAELTNETENTFCVFDLKANIDKDVLGTGGTNNLVVTTTGQAQSITWVIKMTGIKPDEDIQFLVFENRLLARQGSTTNGFIIK